MMKVAVFTTSRADFGIFRPLIEKLCITKDTTLLLFVGGSHLSLKTGNTIDEIRNLGYEITDTFTYLSDQDDPRSILKGLSKAISILADIFKKHQFNFVCILGDRYELMGIVANAILFKKPIIHIHGGESSEGAIDEQIRHMITKASHLHFVTCEEYAENIRRMGESSWRVHNTGALAVDNIVKNPQRHKGQLFKELGLNAAKNIAILTYHPVTLEFDLPIEIQIRNIFSALEYFDGQIVVTSPNVEVEREKIVSLIKEYIDKKKERFYFESLGSENYLNLIPYCDFVIGNSSSGIIEVPFFKIPTINIGDRQKGRIRHESVIDTDYSAEAILNAIKKALSNEFKKQIKKMAYKFGDGHAAERMIEIIKKTKIDQNLMRKRLEF